MSLIRLLYRSDSALNGSDRALREVAHAIAARAADANAAVGVSGALMFSGSVFVQLLEGEAAAVETIFERICRDIRHRRLVLLDYAGADVRQFPDAPMTAFEGDDEARRLFPAIGDATTITRNRLSANASVELIRRLHGDRMRQPKDAAGKFIATDLMT